MKKVFKSKLEKNYSLFEKSRKEGETIFDIVKKLEKYDLRENKVVEEILQEFVDDWNKQHLQEIGNSLKTVIKNKNEEHYLNCEAPICQGDPNPLYRKDVIWYPGEKVCGKKPFHKFQKVQLEINKLVRKGKFKEVGRAYTAIGLEKHSI